MWRLCWCVLLVWSASSLENENANCWSACSKKGGACDWCGEDGLCCRRGYNRTDLEGEQCRSTNTSSLGCSRYHCCVADQEGETGQDTIDVHIPCRNASEGKCPFNARCVNDKTCVCMTGFEEVVNNTGVFCIENYGTTSPSPYPTRAPPTKRPSRSPTEYRMRKSASPSVAPSPQNSSSLTPGEEDDLQSVYWPVFLFLGGVSIVSLFVYAQRRKLKKEQDVFMQMQERLFFGSPTPDAHMQNMMMRQFRGVRTREDIQMQPTDINQIENNNNQQGLNTGVVVAGVAGNTNQNQNQGYMPPPNATS